MRILKVAQTYYPYVAEGGRPVKVRAVAKRLADRGHKVTVLTADLGPVTTGLEIAKREYDRSGWRTVEGGVEALYLKTRLRYRAHTLNPDVLRFCRERLQEFEVVHIYGLLELLGPITAFHCRRSGIPYVVEPMGMSRPKDRSLWLKQLYNRWLGEDLIRGAQRVIATSEQESRELIASGVPEGKVILRRNGIEYPQHLPDRGRFKTKWGIQPGVQIVLFIGRMAPIKSLDLLLEAFAALLKEEQSLNCVLVLVGPDERDGYPQKIKALGEKLGILQKVLMTGPIYGDERWAAYHDADIFVLPSRYESYGNVAAEAVACGTPVLLTDRCGIAPVLKDRAALVVTHNQDALRAGLGRLLHDHKFLEELRAGCPALKPELSWDGPTAAMESLYQSLVGFKGLAREEIALR